MSRKENCTLLCSNLDRPSGECALENRVTLAQKDEDLTEDAKLVILFNILHFLLPRCVQYSRKRETTLVAVDRVLQNYGGKFTERQKKEIKKFIKR